MTLDVARFVLSSATTLSFPRTAGTLDRLQSDPTFVLTIRIPEYWRADDKSPHNNLPLPEFEETGFLGRSVDRAQVQKLLRSHYPVVSIVGEGGVGKTALALRCLYDLLDEPESKYDAIVWASMKTAALTQSGVKQVAHAITSTLGLLSDIASTLGVPNTADRSQEAILDEIVQYLEIYRVLIAIDNLETISSGALRELLIRLPGQSKLLITSRVGIGEFEARYALSEMDEKTGIALMRSYARVLGMKEVAALPEAQLKGYCRKLFNNPLLIKWFVATVGRGANPAQLMSRNSKTFQEAISFCFANLFDKLGDKEQHVIQTLVCAKRSLSSAELHYLNSELTPTDVEMALGTLHNSSIVLRSVGQGGGAEYSLSESATTYLAVHSPPSSAYFLKIQAALRQLKKDVERDNLATSRYEYDPFIVRYGTTRDERIAGSYLRRALDLWRSDMSAARHAISEAKQLAPGSGEVWRVSAIVEGKAGELFKAVNEYEQAVDLSPTSKVVNYNFGVFLMVEMEDADAALPFLQKAESLDPGNPSVLTAKAMALSRLGRYPEAAAIYEELAQALPSRGRRWRISGADQAADCYKRWARQQLDLFEYEAAKKYLLRALEIFLDSARRQDIDAALERKIFATVTDCLYNKVFAEDLTFIEDVISRCEELMRYIPRLRLNINFESVIGLNANATKQALLERFAKLRDEASLHVPEDVSLPRAGAGSRSPQGGQELQGEIHNLQANGRYGFIRDDFSGRHFFHFNELRPEDFPHLKVGLRVLFKLGLNPAGQCAVEVRRDGRG